MKKWLLFTTLTFWAAANAQHLDIDIPAVGMLNYNTFIIKEGDSYTTVQLYVAFNESTKKLEAKLHPDGITGTLEELLKRNNTTKEALRQMETYNIGNASKIMARLDTIQFTFPDDSIPSGGYRKKRLMFYSGIYNYANLENQNFYLRKGEVKALAPYTNQYRVVSVTVNRRYTLLALFQPGFRQPCLGYVCGYKGWVNFHAATLKKPKIETFAMSTKPANPNTMPPATEVKQANGKWAIYEAGTNMMAVPVEFDSITRGHTFYVAFKDGNAQAITANGTQKKPLPAVQAIYVSHYGVVSVVSGTKTHYVGLDGNLADEMPMGNFDGCGTVPRIIRTISVKNGYYVCTITVSYGTETVNEYRLCKASEYKDLNLFNGTKADEYMSTYLPWGLNIYNTFITTAANGKKGLVTINYQEANPAIVPVLAPGDYIFHTGENDYPYLFEKNGLKNYLLVSLEPKYATLGAFDKNFARFILPNGTQGWLAMDGKEYLDE